MSYAHNNHYKWIESNENVKCSELGKEVANILGFVGGGIYNAPISYHKTDWAHENYIEVIWEGYMSNYDFARLTYLLIECFERMIRVTINPHAFRYLKLQFWKRYTREGSISERLPTLETMIDIQNKLYGRENDS